MHFDMMSMMSEGFKINKQMRKDMHTNKRMHTLLVPIDLLVNTEGVFIGALNNSTCCLCEWD